MYNYTYQMQYNHNGENTGILDDKMNKLTLLYYCFSLFYSQIEIINSYPQIKLNVSFS